MDRCFGVGRYIIAKNMVRLNYHSVKVECCHQIHRLSRSNGITILKLFSTFDGRFLSNFSQFAVHGIESDNLEFICLLLFFSGPRWVIAPFLQNCMQYIVPELVILRNETALKCLTESKHNKKCMNYSYTKKKKTIEKVARRPQ